MKHSGLFRGCLSSVNVLGHNKNYIQSLRDQKQIEVNNLLFDTTLAALNEIHEEDFHYIAILSL